MRSSQVTEAPLRPVLTSPHLPSIGQIKFHSHTQHQWVKEMHTAHFNGRCCEDAWPESWVYDFIAEKEGRIGNKPIYQVLSVSQLTSSDVSKFDPVIFLFLLSIPTFASLQLTYRFTEYSPSCSPTTHSCLPHHARPLFPSDGGPFFM